jgi:hypothetical protein
MAASPAFITQYEILRSRDYVLIAFSYPTGEITDGSMRTEEAQRIALTIPRFLELAGAMSQIAHSIQAANQPRPQTTAPAKRGGRSIEDQREGAEADAEVKPLGDWVVRH